MYISMSWYLQNICLWVWVFIASLARKHRTQTRDYFLLLSASQGGETSITWGRIVQGANWRGGETSINRWKYVTHFQDFVLTMRRDAQTHRHTNKHHAPGHTALGGGIKHQWTGLQSGRFTVVWLFLPRDEHSADSYQLELWPHTNCLLRQMAAEHMHTDINTLKHT